MKNFIFIISFIFLISCEEVDITQNTSRGLVINEFLASNDACCPDDSNDYDDWVELYNDTPDPIDIGGMYFTDTPGDDKPYQIPSNDPSKTTIASKGYLLIWCDDDQEQGPLHVSKKLKKGGESIILLRSDGISVVDSLTYGQQTTDISMGRNSDNFEEWIFFNNPSPGFPNN
ncbi:MAG: lamin tail domain-containing protein [Bacteroidota bacterium]|jgi:hypothetical protein|nr:lamin tail domain-containing protein [Bacteroidota bacterium]|tara:strand:+ start:60 stop:578 length:519 start_codon:yes stop_codon:yes gene_type:complete